MTAQPTFKIFAALPQSISVTLKVGHGERPQTTNLTTIGYLAKDMTIFYAGLMFSTLIIYGDILSTPFE